MSHSPTTIASRPVISVAAIVERDGTFLMVEENTALGLQLNQPAGHLERDESLLDAVIREVREETAYPFTPLYFLGIYHNLSRSTPNHPGYVRIAFVGSVGEPLGTPLDTPVVRALWLKPEAIDPQRCRSTAVLRCIDDYQRGVRLPLSHVADLRN